MFGFCLSCSVMSFSCRKSCFQIKWMFPRIWDTLLPYKAGSVLGVSSYCLQGNHKLFLHIFLDTKWIILCSLLKEGAMIFPIKKIHLQVGHSRVHHHMKDFHQQGKSQLQFLDQLRSSDSVSSVEKDKKSSCVGVAFSVFKLKINV